MIEVRYAGVVIGRTAIVRELDTRGVFLGITEPMPVGTPVSLRVGDQPIAEAVQGKVDAVSESQELAGAGMRVRFAEPRSAALFGSPKPAAPEPEIVPEVMDAAAAAGPVAASASVAADASRDAGSPGAAGPAEAGHRRIVVDASTEKDDAGVPESPAGDEGDLSTSAAGETGRIPAPDALAFGAGGGGGMGKKGRRNRRR